MPKSTTKTPVNTQVQSILDRIALCGRKIRNAKDREVAAEAALKIEQLASAATILLWRANKDDRHAGD